MFLVDRDEELAISSDGFALAEEEVSWLVQAVVQHRHDPPLQVGVEVDEHVATADEIQLGERRIPREVVPHEHA